MVGNIFHIKQKAQNKLSQMSIGDTPVLNYNIAQNIKNNKLIHTYIRGERW